MQKKRIGILIASACALLCAAALSACSHGKGPEEPEGPGTNPPPDQTVHTHDYVPNVVAPLCAKDGYTEYRCECGANYVGDETDALGHDVEGDACKRCGAHATEGLAYVAVSGGYAVSGIGKATGTDIIIPSEHGGQPVVAVADNAFRYNKNIEYVTLSDTVKTVGEQAFYDCGALKRIWLGKIEELGSLSLCSQGITRVELPDTLKKIGSAVFSSLKMERIHIPASVESIGARAFSGCDIESITVDSANEHYRSVDNCVIGPVTDNDGTRTVLLFGCKNSRIPNDGSFSEIYDAAFAGVVGLNELVIPDGIEKLGSGVFADSDMRSLKIGKGLKHISYGVFQNCENLVRITVDPQNETFTAAGNCVIDKAKKAVVIGCKASVIPTDPEVVTAIAGNAFRECPVPEDFAIPANVTSIGGYAFARSGLKSVTVRGNLTSAESAFASCTSLKNVTFEAGVTKIAKAMFANTAVEHVTLPETVTEIGERAFMASALTEITIPGQVTVIPSGAFDTCTALTQVVIPNGVTTLEEYAFANCYNLVKVTLGTGVSKIGKYAFNNCHKLTELVNLSGLEIQKSTTSKPEVFGNIGYALATTKFQRANLDCYFAGEIYTSTDYTSKLDFVDGFVFYNNDGAWELYACGVVGDVTLPTSYKGMNYDVASGAFAYYTPASSVTIKSGVNELKAYSFFYNRDTERVDFSGIQNTGYYVFQQCSKLKSITFRNSVAVGAYTTVYCDAVEEINLHNVTTIGQCAFVPGTSYSSGESDKLTVVTITGECDLLDGYAFCNYTARDAVVVLSKDIKAIKCYSFYNCGFDTLFFTGTREEWKAMSIEYAPEEYAAINTLNSVEVYCYSESAPTGEGNYWHYASDGKTPVKW